MIGSDISCQNLWLGQLSLLQYHSIEITWSDFTCTPSKVSYPHHSQMEQTLQEYETPLSYESRPLRYRFHTNFCFKYPIQRLY